MMVMMILPEGCAGLWITVYYYPHVQEVRRLGRMDHGDWIDFRWLPTYTRDTRSIDTTTRIVSSAAVMPCLSDDTHSTINPPQRRKSPTLTPIHPFTHPPRQTSQAIRSTLHFTSRLGTTDRLRLVPSLPPALPCLSSLLSALEEKLAPYDEKPILHTPLVSVALHHAGTVRLTSDRL